MRREVPDIRPWRIWARPVPAQGPGSLFLPAGGVLLSLERDSISEKAVSYTFVWNPNVPVSCTVVWGPTVLDGGWRPLRAPPADRGYSLEEAVALSFRGSGFRLESGLSSALIKMVGDVRMFALSLEVMEG